MRSPDWRRAVIVVSAAALIRLLFAALIPVFPDETYYWEWSRHLASGYFDHPGGLALLIRAGRGVLAPFGLGDSSVGVRLGAVVAGWIAALATAAMARRLNGDAAGLRAAVIITVLPLAAAGLILATPDAPLLAATAAGLYCLVRALESAERSTSSLRWWALTGLALGAAFCSKYTSIFLPVGVVLAVLVRPGLRSRLREPGPYVACIVATLVFVPVLAWNARHEWISFLFQVKHGLGQPEGSALRAAWRHEGDFFGGQAALASPIIFIMLAIATFRGLVTRPPNAATRHDDVRFVLAVVALLSFGFFTYSALRQRVEPNWPAPAYIPAIALLATTPWERTGRRWLRWGIVFAAVMSLIIYAQGVAPVLPIPAGKDPIARAFGWRELTLQADSAAALATAETHRATWLAGDRYQEASELAFHNPAHPATFATNLSGRSNQYDLWPRFPARAKAGDNLVMVVDDSDDGQPHEAIRALAPYFAEVRRGPTAPLRRGASEIGTRRIWTLVGWVGRWPPAR